MNAELLATNRRLLGERPTPFAPAQVVVGHAASVGPASNGFASPAGSIAVGAQQAAHMRPQTAPPAPSLGGPASSIKRQRTTLIATTSAASGTVGFQASLALRVAAQHNFPPTKVPTKVPSSPSFTAFRAAPTPSGSTPGSAHNHPKPVHPAPKHAPIHNGPKHASGVAAAAPTRTPVHAGLPRTSTFVAAPAPAPAPRAHAKVVAVTGPSRPTSSLTIVPSLSAPSVPSFRPISVAASSSDASPSAAVSAPTAIGAASIDTPMSEPHPQGVDLSGTTTTSSGTTSTSSGSGTTTTSSGTSTAGSGTNTTSSGTSTTADGAQFARPKLPTLGEEIGALKLNAGPESRPGSPSGLRVTVSPTFVLLVLLVPDTIEGTTIKRYYLHAYFPIMTNPHWMVTNDRGQYTFKSKGTATECWKWRLPDWGFRAKAEDCEQDREEFEKNLQEQFRLFVLNRAQPVRSLRRGVLPDRKFVLLKRAMQAHIKQFFQALAGKSERSARISWAADMLASRTA